MADKLHELSEQIAALLKTTGPILPRQFYYPGCLVEQAAEQFKDQDWYINGHDGSQYYHGVQTKWPCTTMDATRLNARIATMDLPDYLKKVSPKRNNLYLLDLLYRRRYSVFGGMRGGGKTLFNRFMDFRFPPVFERRYVGQWYYRTEEGENHDGQ